MRFALFALCEMPASPSSSLVQDIPLIQAGQQEGSKTIVQPIAIFVLLIKIFCELIACRDDIFSSCISIKFCVPIV